MDSEPPLVEGLLGASNWRDTRWCFGNDLNVDLLTGFSFENPK